MKVAQQEFDPAIPVSKITQHPSNPRRGDDSAVRESVERNGFFGAILVQKSTGHVIAGNTRYRVMSDGGHETVPGFWIDCDDETAKRILLADNRTSDLAFYDDTELFKLLQSLNEGEGLDGTGYDRAAFELLLQSVQDDSVVGGVRQGMSPEERIDDYNDIDLRSIILPYDGRTYERIAAQLQALRREWDVESNAEVVERLLDEATETLEILDGELDVEVP